MLRWKALFIALVAALCIPVQTATAAPLSEPASYIQFEGWASQFTDKTEIDVSVLIHNSRGPIQVQVTRVTYSLVTGAQRLVSEEYGTGYLTPEQLVVDELTSVTAAAIGIEMFDCDARGCRSTGVEEVAAVLTGTGPTSIDTERGSYRADGCNVRYADTYQSRDASSSLRFGDQSFSGGGALLSVIYHTYVAGCGA